MGLMMEGTKIVEQPNSCKISINGKGVWSGEIKVYSETIDEAMSRAVLKAEELNGIMKENR